MLYELYGMRQEEIKILEEGITNRKDAVMKEMFEWLNMNQGAAITILTLVYVVATIVIVWKMRKSNYLIRESNDISRKAIEQSMQFERQRNRPYVIFDLVVKNEMLCAKVTNIGRQPAYHVQIATDPEILRSLSGREVPVCFMERKIALLAPSREIDDFVDLVGNFLRKYAEITFNVELSYKDFKGETYQQKDQISIGFLKTRMFTKEEDPMKDIAKSLNKIAAYLEHTRKRT